MSISIVRVIITLYKTFDAVYFLCDIVAFCNEAFHVIRRLYCVFVFDLNRVSSSPFGPPHPLQQTPPQLVEVTLAISA